jgi:Fe2+ transport system protein B
MTGVCDWSDRCQVPVRFVAGESLDVCSFGLWCFWLVLGRFQVGLLGFVDVLVFLPIVILRWFLFQVLEKSLWLPGTFLCT